jgi:hypothetical protein
MMNDGFQRYFFCHRLAVDIAGSGAYIVDYVAAWCLRTCEFNHQHFMPPPCLDNDLIGYDDSWLAKWLNLLFIVLVYIHFTTAIIYGF